MGYWNGWWPRKFYEEQVAWALALIERYFADNISTEAYLSMCEQMGKEPDPNEMPPTLGDFPLEIQEAFQIHTMLPDRWDGMSGSYMGKDWSALETLLKVQDVEDKKTVWSSCS